MGSHHVALTLEWPSRSNEVLINDTETVALISLDTLQTLQGFVSK